MPKYLMKYLLLGSLLFFLNLPSCSNEVDLSTEQKIVYKPSLEEKNHGKADNAESAVWTGTRGLL